MLAISGRKPAFADLDRLKSATAAAGRSAAHRFPAAADRLDSEMRGTHLLFQRRSARGTKTGSTEAMLEMGLPPRGFSEQPMIPAQFASKW